MSENTAEDDASFVEQMSKRFLWRGHHNDYMERLVALARRACNPVVPRVVDHPDGYSAFMLENVPTYATTCGPVEVVFAHPEEEDGYRFVGARWPTRELPAPQPDAAPEGIGVSDADLAATLVLDLSKARITIGDLQNALATARRDGWIEGRDAAAEVADVKFGAPPPQVAGARKAITCAIRALSPPEAAPPAPVPAGEVAEAVLDKVAWLCASSRTTEVITPHRWKSWDRDWKNRAFKEAREILQPLLTASRPRADAGEVTEAELDRMADAAVTKFQELDDAGLYRDQWRAVLRAALAAREPRS